jgi:hypothetical protein
MTFWLGLGQPVFWAFLSDLQKILEADDRFSNIGWFPKNGISRRLMPASGPLDP